MADYTQGKIYTIECHSDDTKIYVGSTTMILSERLRAHKMDALKNPTRFIYATINNDWDEWYIELYENYPCNNRKELEKREGDIIQLISTLNMKIAGRTAKEYHLDNAETIKEKRKQYLKDNAEKIKEYKQQYRKDNAETIKETRKQYLKDNAAKITEQRKQYIKDNAEKIKEQRKQYIKDNAETIKETRKQYLKDNAENIKAQRKQYRKDNAETIKEQG